MPWALTMSGEGSPQAKSPLMQGDPDKDGALDKMSSVGPGSIAVDMNDGASAAPKRRPPSWRLKYQDFTINRQQNSARQPEEGFQSLVDKANDWLQKASDCSVLTCETLQWTATRAHLLEDSEQMMMSRAVAENSQTYYKRGLRLWLTPRPVGCRQAPVLAYTDYAPETHDALQHVIHRANKSVTNDGIDGKIITIETVQAPILNGNVDSAGLCWSEKCTEESPWAMVLRTFYIKDKKMKETIGVKDFIPQQTSEGFEPFSQLIEKANKWLKDQSDIRVTNMQSIILPKRDSTPLLEISSVCFTTIPSIQNTSKLEYLRILRVAYTNPAEDALSELPLVYPFYFETFTPELVTPKDSKKRERMERMKETFSRVATFLRNTELDVICVEVVPNPIHITDADSSVDDDKQQMRFLCTLRLYLNGQVNIDSVARSLLAAVQTSHTQPAPTGGKSAPTQQSPLLPHQYSLQQSHYPVPIPMGGHTNNSKFTSTTKSLRDKSRTRVDSLDTSHPGPIFLRHVTVGPRRNRMIIAFVTVFVAITIIVVLSVFYSNKLNT